jgi:hypothetical protein
MVRGSATLETVYIKILPCPSSVQKVPIFRAEVNFNIFLCLSIITRRIISNRFRPNKHDAAPCGSRSATQVITIFNFENVSVASQ